MLINVSTSLLVYYLLASFGDLLKVTHLLGLNFDDKRTSLLQVGNRGKMFYGILQLFHLCRKILDATTLGKMTLTLTTIGLMAPGIKFIA